MSIDEAPTTQNEINNTQEFTVAQSTQGDTKSTVVGELHQTENHSKEEEERLGQIFEENKDSLIILESDHSKSNVWTNTENKPMAMTKRFAEENGNMLEIMDDDKIEFNRYEVWRNAQSNISEQEFDFMSSLHYVHTSIVNRNMSAQEVVTTIVNSNHLNETRKQTYLYGFNKYADLLSSPNKEENFKKISELIRSFYSYDGVCRERYYQDKIAHIKENNPNKDILAVFGKSHTEGILKTLEDSSYRTPLSAEAKLRWQITDLKSTN
jgi:hypothetical protein